MTYSSVSSRRRLDDTHAPTANSAYHRRVQSNTKRACCGVLAAFLALSCRAQEPSVPDAGDVNPDASPGDAGVDAGAPDAGGPCPGGMAFTGGYEDWDSTPGMFDGVEFATVAQADEPGNSAMTAPNGRVDTLCLPSARTGVDFVQADYLDLRYTATPDTTRLPFAVRGLTPARADDLFAQELGLARDIQTASVTVSVRYYPSGDPVVGARVSLGNGNAGAYTADAAGTFSPGDTLTGSPVVLFANVAVDGGLTTVQVSPPPGVNCQGPADIDVVAGALAATDFVCTEQ